MKVAKQRLLQSCRVLKTLKRDQVWNLHISTLEMNTEMVNESFNMILAHAQFVFFL